MAINLLLLPFAYIKTIWHKVNLLRHYKSRTHCLELCIFIFGGIFLLLLAQFSDAYYFMKHSTSLKQRQQ